jgi:hypothetical protein
MRADGQIDGRVRAGRARDREFSLRSKAFVKTERRPAIDAKRICLRYRMRF